MLEMTHVGFWLTSVSEDANVLDFTLRFLFSRVMFGCGVCKINSDWMYCHGRVCDLGHAFPSHWEVQEMPSVLSWYMHKLPDSIQKCFTLGTLAVECLVAFFVWGTRAQALASTVGLTAALMCGIMSSGSFGVFPLTMLMVSIALATRDLDVSRTRSENGVKRTSPFEYVLRLISRLYAICVVLLSVQIYVLDRYRISLPSSAVSVGLERLRSTNSETLLIVGTYGVFSKIMHDQHRSIAIEGRNDASGDDWETCPWAFLPSKTNAMPLFLGPWTFGYLERKLYNNMKHEPNAIPIWAVCVMRAMIADDTIVPMSDANRHGLPQGSFRHHGWTSIRLTRTRWRYTTWSERSETNQYFVPDSKTHVVAGPVTLSELDDILSKSSIDCGQQRARKREKPLMLSHTSALAEAPFDHDSLFGAFIMVSLVLYMGWGAVGETPSRKKMDAEEGR
eukprot:g1194.t1